MLGVCALHCDGTPWRGAAVTDGVAFLAARRSKNATTQNLCLLESAQDLEAGGRLFPEIRSVHQPAGEGVCEERSSYLSKVCKHSESISVGESFCMTSSS